MLKLNEEVSLDVFTKKLNELYSIISVGFEHSNSTRTTPYCYSVSSDCSLCKNRFWWYEDLITGNNNNVKKLNEGSCPSLEVFDFEGLYKAALKAVIIGKADFNFIVSSFSSVFCNCSLNHTVFKIAKKIRENKNIELDDKELNLEILLKMLSYFKEKEKKEKEL